MRKFEKAGFKRDEEYRCRQTECEEEDFYHNTCSLDDFMMIVIFFSLTKQQDAPFIFSDDKTLYEINEKDKKGISLYDLITFSNAFTCKGSEYIVNGKIKIKRDIPPNEEVHMFSIWNFMQNSQYNNDYFKKEEPLIERKRIKDQQDEEESKLRKRAESIQSISEYPSLK